MESTTIVCDARQPSGLPCGETAVIHTAHHHYSSPMFRPGTGGRFQQILVETHYEIECPKCGKRIQIVKANR